MKIRLVRNRMNGRLGTMVDFLVYGWRGRTLLNVVTFLPRFVLLNVLVDACAVLLFGPVVLAAWLLYRTVH